MKTINDAIIEAESVFDELVSDDKENISQCGLKLSEVVADALKIEKTNPLISFYAGVALAIGSLALTDDRKKLQSESFNHLHTMWKFAFDYTKSADVFDQIVSNIKLVLPRIHYYYKIRLATLAVPSGDAGAFLSGMAFFKTKEENALIASISDKAKEFKRDVDAKELLASHRGDDGVQFSDWKKTFDVIDSKIPGLLEGIVFGYGYNNKESFDQVIYADSLYTNLSCFAHVLDPDDNLKAETLIQKSFNKHLLPIPPADFAKILKDQHKTAAEDALDRYWKAHEKTHAAIKQNISELEKQLESAKAQQKNVQTAYDSLQNECNEATVEESKAINKRQEIEELKEALAALGFFKRKEKDLLRNEISSKENELIALQTAADNSRTAKNKKYNNRLEVHKNELAGLDTKIKTCEEDIENLKKELVHPNESVIRSYEQKSK